MNQHADWESEQGGPEEDITEHAVHVAEELAAILGQVNEDMRQDLLHYVEDTLAPHGIHIVDAHTYANFIRVTPAFDPDALPGVPGKQTGRTRFEILADLALMRVVTRKRRRGQ